MKTLLHIKLILFPIFIFVLSLNATQQIKISGRVLNSDSTSVPDAKIRLAIADIETASDSDGVFLLLGDLKVTSNRFGGATSLPFGFNGRILTFSVSEKPEKVLIEVYNILGKRIGVLIDRNFETGVYSYNPLAASSHLVANGFYLLRVRVGKKSYTFKMSGVHLETLSGGGLTIGKTSPVLTKKKEDEVLDTLVVLKDGYYRQEMTITIYEKEFNEIFLYELPEIPSTENIGNDKLIILNMTKSEKAEKLSIAEFNGEIDLPYENDRMISTPLEIISPNINNNENGYLLRIPLKLDTINNCNNLTVHALIKIDTVIIPYYGFLTNDTLNISFSHIDSGVVVVATYNPYMVAININYDSLENVSGLRKRISGNNTWSIYKWWAAFDVNDSYLRQYAAEMYSIDENDVKFDHINGILSIRLFVPAYFISVRYELMGFREPTYNTIIDPPRSHFLADHPSTDHYKGKYFVLNLTKGATLNSNKIGINMGSFWLNSGSESLNKELGKPKGLFAHECMHGVSYRYSKLFLDNYKFSKDSQQYEFEEAFHTIHESIATLSGHTMEYYFEELEEIRVRPSPLEIQLPKNTTPRNYIYMLNKAFLQDTTDIPIDVNGKKYTLRTRYIYHDFFAYIAKKYKNKSLAFLSEMLEEIRENWSKLKGDETYDDYVMINLNGVNQYFENSVWKYYAEFVENRAYEHNAESSLRDKDKDDWEGVWKLRKDLFTESTTIPSFKDIPSFASRHITLAIPPESFDTTTFLLIFAKTVPIQPDSLRIVYYPESSERIGNKDKKIIFDRKVHGWNIYDRHNVDTVILALNDFKDSNGGLYGTFLLMNCSYRSVDSVSFQLLNKPLIKITFDDYNNRKVPAVIDFEPKITPPGYPMKKGKWFFSDNDISFVEKPTNLYAKQGTYNVSLTCETPDGTTLQCDTTIKIEPYDIVTTENRSYSMKCEGAVCDNAISGKGKGILFDYGTILSNFDATFEFSIGGGNSDCESVCTLFIAPEGGDWDILWSTTEGRTAKSNTTYSGHIYNEDRSFTYLAAYAPSCGMELLDFTAHLKPTAIFYVSKTDAVVGETITFEADCVPLENDDPEVTKIISYQWDFGDGNYVSTTDLKVSHVYSVPEKYQVTLFITDAQGGNDYRTEIITVSE